MPRNVKQAQTAVRFRGVPASVTGVVPEGVDSSADVLLSVLGVRGEKTPVEYAVEIDLDPRVLHVTLPAEFAPGSYDGTLSVSGTTRPVAVEVDGEIQLRVFPEQLRIMAKAGVTVTEQLSILNSGNVTVTLRGVQAFGVMMAGGIERALRRAYVQRTPPEQRRIDILADSLAEAHGGLVKMRLINGAGPLAPGELRDLDVEVSLPKELAPASEYTGNWEIPGLTYPVSLMIAGTPADGGGHDEPNGGDVPVVK